MPIPPFWLANEIEIGFLSIILLWLNSVCFSYSVGLASSQTQHLSGSCVLPDPASYRIRHLFGSCILPDPASYKTRHLSGSCILPDPASHRTRHLSGSCILPDPASYKTRRLFGSCVLLDPMSCNILMLLLPEPGTNKRVKPAERYLDGHKRTRTDKNGLSNVKILPLPLQREDYLFGIEV